MLIENMTMAFSAIRTNKLRSALTMLGIIIGIGSVISIVSIGDTMRSMFADLYKNIGLTQAYLSIGYWVDDVRQSDYFTLDEMERIKEAFPDEIAYIDSSAMTSADAVYKREKITFDYTGIDYNYQNVQPVNIVYGRYLNEGDILGRKKNAVMDTDSAKMLFGTENAVGKTFRTTLYGSTDDFTVGIKCVPGSYDGQNLGPGSCICALYAPDLAQRLFLSASYLCLRRGEPERFL